MRSIGTSVALVATVVSLGACRSAAGPAAPMAEPGTVARMPSTDGRAGPFTAAQATRGEATFQRSCARCHEIERFSTPTFLRAWTRAPLNQLFGFISTRMPPSAPGSLSRPQYADVVAYLLARNGLPAGAEELPSTGAALASIRITPP